MFVQQLVTNRLVHICIGESMISILKTPTTRISSTLRTLWSSKLKRNLRRNLSTLRNIYHTRINNISPKIGSLSIWAPKMNIWSIRCPMMNILRSSMGIRCYRMNKWNSRIDRLNALIRVLHTRLNNWWRNLHIDRRTPYNHFLFQQVLQLPHA